MRRHRITLVVVPLLLALATSAQVQPPPPQQQDNTQNGASDEPLTFAEVMPTYPGGEAAYKNYLAKNLQYPEAARQANIGGKVFVGFVVEKDGSLTNVTVVRTVPVIPGSADLDREAERLVRSMSRWNPGKHNGEAVAVRMEMPVVFRLHAGTPSN